MIPRDGENEGDEKEPNETYDQGILHEFLR
jgi:hypothetical protein